MSAVVRQYKGKVTWQPAFMIVKEAWVQEEVLGYKHTHRLYIKDTHINNNIPHASSTLDGLHFVYISTFTFYITSGGFRRVCLCVWWLWLRSKETVHLYDKDRAYWSQKSNADQSHFPYKFYALELLFASRGIAQCCSLAVQIYVNKLEWFKRFKFIYIAQNQNNSCLKVLYIVR